MDRKKSSRALFYILAGVLICVVGFIMVRHKKTSNFGRAPEIYQKQCASCHGPKGFGDGKAAYLLFPRPRDFSLGRFRIVTTKTGFPTDEDLFRTISRGMPGSAMPPWGHLPEEDIRDLVGYVRQLTYDGMVMRRSENIKSAEALQEVKDSVGTRLTPGTTLELSKEIPSTPNSLQVGKDLYVKACAGCHGLSGKGDGNSNTKDEQGYFLPPNDFSKGIFKGSGSSRDIAYRIRLGMPGSAMPSFELGNDEYLWSIAHYVQSLAPDDAEKRTTQHRQFISAQKVDTLHSDPLDPTWDKIEPTFIALMPLWVHNGKYIDGVNVRATYNKKDVSFHLTWRDDSKNEEQKNMVDTFSDGIALQFTNEADPPFFGMGDISHPVNIWLWKPDNQNFKLPNRPAQDLNAHGLGTLEMQKKNEQNVSAKGVWKDGFWRIVFTRSLISSHNGDIEFSPRQSKRMGLAVWDGAQKDRDGQKSVTIWHDLLFDQTPK